jgi:hypothetical protein
VKEQTRGRKLGLSMRLNPSCHMHPVGCSLETKTSFCPSPAGPWGDLITVKVLGGTSSSQHLTSHLLEIVLESGRKDRVSFPGRTHAIHQQDSYRHAPWALIGKPQSSCSLPPRLSPQSAVFARILVSSINHNQRMNIKLSAVWYRL